MQSKSNPNPAIGKKTSLLIVLEATGVRFQKVQYPIHAHLCYKMACCTAHKSSWWPRNLL